MNNFIPFTKIGIIGGGQLGKMITQKAKKMGFWVTVLDPTKNSPAGQIADNQIAGNFYDKNKLKELVEQCDVTTYDIEHINTGALKKLVHNGNTIYPSPDLLEIIQDKLQQKNVLSQNGIPVPKYKKIKKSDFQNPEKLHFPIVQKARKGGYDGKGVVVIRNKNDLKLKNILQVDSFIEEFVDIKKELAVMVARNQNGEVRTYPVVEMLFDKRINVCDMVIAPARIENQLQEKAKKVAVKSIECLDGVGIFGVEMFLSKDKKILVNEIAPRPHNSGHYTIEACVTCQFEQHIRAITNLPPGSTDLIIPAVMLNLLGEEGYEGSPVVEGLQEALAIDGVSFHFYGKKKTYPFRKMGHVTIVNKNLEKAIEIAKKVKTFLKIKGELKK